MVLMISSVPADPATRDVLSNYAPAFMEGSWTALGNAGGFSGAGIWRSELADGGEFCLRRWPTGKMNEDRLSVIHHAIAVLGALPFVPKIIPTNSGDTWVNDGEVLWEITTWMPGRADFHSRPTDARLYAAMRALAAMHERLKPPRESLAPCPAVNRILRALGNWRSLLHSGWKPDFRTAATRADSRAGPPGLGGNLRRHL